VVEPPGLPRRWPGPASTVGRVDKRVELEFMLSSGLLCVVRSIHLYMRKRREKSIWPRKKKLRGPEPFDGGSGAGRASGRCSK
jgi:hypothetical protein